MTVRLLIYGLPTKMKFNKFSESCEIANFFIGLLYKTSLNEYYFLVAFFTLNDIFILRGTQKY